MEGGTAENGGLGHVLVGSGEGREEEGRGGGFFFWGGLGLEGRGKGWLFGGLDGDVDLMNGELC